ncbi:MAG: DUF4412 domain-containing protein [Roseivirga sp.]|nr:DUF4412 domain-containing protein [Roseivirga sp.]
MKLSALLLSLIFISGPFSTSEIHRPFEGTVVYSIEYIEVPDGVKGMESMLPQTTSMSISRDLVKVEQEVMGGSQIVIVDNKKKESHILMDMMGQKLDVFLSREEIEAAEKENPEMKIEELDGGKTILGYKCKEALITNPDTGDTQRVFYTEKLEIEHKDFKSLKGFPLEYQTSQQGMKLKMTVIEITKKKLPASHFEVPDGYQQMTMDELTEMMGGN